MGRFDPGAALVLINRRDYWQCGYVIPKGAADAVRAAGLPAFRDRLARLLPWWRIGSASSRDWEQVKLLTVQIDRLKHWWRPGLLCIGDAAHAMSPVGGVGINLAIQDAVAAGISSAAATSRRPICAASSAGASGRRAPRSACRSWRRTGSFRRVLQSRAPLRRRSAFACLARFAWLRRLPGRLIGMGVRPEHVCCRRSTLSESADLDCAHCEAMYYFTRITLAKS